MSDQKEAFDERAAIIQFCSGLPTMTREQAEKLAAEQMGLTDEFFDTCKSQIGKSKRYLTKDMSSGRYVDEWKLVIPENIYNMKNGVIEDATI